jgi:hypothetical protein
MVILEDIRPTVGTTRELTSNIYAARRAHSGAIAYLMTAFWTLDYHLFKSKL